MSRQIDNDTTVIPVKLNVLIIDDSGFSRRMLRQILENGGYEVDEATGGFEALERYSLKRADVVLLDIGLPMMDGYQVARRLREVAETRASCLIALTGYGQPADRERARVAGFDHHLTKPADPDALLALVDAWIESSGARRVSARAAGAAVGNAVD